MHNLPQYGGFLHQPAPSRPSLDQTRLNVLADQGWRQLRDQHDHQSNEQLELAHHSFHPSQPQTPLFSYHHQYQLHRPNHPSPYFASYNYHHLPQAVIMQAASYPAQQQQPPLASSDHSTFQSAPRVSTRLVARSSTSSPDASPAPTIYSFNPSYLSEVGQKRARSTTNSEDDTEHGNKSKKVRKAPTSKRGNNAKKAPIFKYVENGDVKRDAIPFQNINFESSSHWKVELQNSRCMLPKYRDVKELPKCLSCTRRGKDDLCRFQGFRYLIRDPENEEIRGVSFIEIQPLDNSHSPKFPTQWNVHPTLESVDTIKSAVVNALLPMLESELRHISSQMKVCYRQRESDCRATCDTCLTSIFSSSWACRTCGRECCNDCYKLFHDSVVIPPNLSPEALTERRRIRANFLENRRNATQCTKKADHSPDGFVPVSRFRKGELETAIEGMKTLQQQQGPPRTPSPLLGRSNSSASSSSLAGAVDLPPDHLHTPTFTVEHLNEATFLPLWSRGIPIHVTGVGNRLQLAWTPEYFVREYGDKQCALYDCQTEKSEKSTVAEFFAQFGKSQPLDEEGKPMKSLKLKDWPPTNDFKNEFKSEYDDFVNAVPMPDFARPDGRLNIASMFPENHVKPDLGPKMYNAQANFISAGSKGSTRLHMDMADAVNIMPYAASDPKDPSKPGCAAWDLFRAEDSDAIRQFLKEKCLTKEIEKDLGIDPIHGQQFYLDEDLLRKLREEKGVRSYRVYQRQGEAVFIPAGCAHQVCNLADCVKVAVDFVSPQNIARCEKLTKEFRDLNTRAAWKEDVLQLKTMMWFAWLCSRELEGKFGRESSASHVSSNEMDVPGIRQSDQPSLLSSPALFGSDAAGDGKIVVH